MSNVILVIHLLLALAIIGLVLLQRSEGGGILGSSGGGLGGFATPHATANAMTRATWICVGLFFVTSLTLGVLAGQATSKRSILDHLDEPKAAATAPAESGKSVDQSKKSEPKVPTSE